LNYTSSLSHGWGGSPTWFLSTYVLGASRAGPNTWVVKPAFSGVNYASGQIPLQTGDLQVSWEHQFCRESGLELTAPISSTGKAIIPLLNPTTVITLDNRMIWRDETPLVDGIERFSDGAHIPIEAGMHTLAARQDCNLIYLPALSKQLMRGRND